MWCYCVKTGGSLPISSVDTYISLINLFNIIKLSCKWVDNLFFSTISISLSASILLIISFIHYTKHIAVQQYIFRTNMFYKHTSLSRSLARSTMLRKLQELLKTVRMPVHRDSTPGLYFKIAYYVKRHFERHKISNILAIFSQTVISNQHDMIDLNT